jgi:hypothetical protein
LSRGSLFGRKLLLYLISYQLFDFGRQCSRVLLGQGSLWLWLALSAGGHLVVVRQLQILREDKIG